MIKNITVLSLFFLNSTMMYSMASKARAVASKLPVVSALAAAQLYKEYEDTNNKKREKRKERYGTTQLDVVNDYPMELLGRVIGFSDAGGVPTSYIQSRIEKRLTGKIPDLSKVHIVRSNRQGIGKKKAWYEKNDIMTHATHSPYAVADETLGDHYFIGMPEDPRIGTVGAVEHEISHVERNFLIKFNNWYRQHGRELHIPLAMDACLVLVGLRKKIALGAVALAHSFHDQMANLVQRYVEQDADDHIPLEKIYLEDCIRDSKRVDGTFRSLYEDDLKNKSQEDTFLSLCELLDQFPLCEDKKWGYSLWQIIKVDPHHPPVNIRLEKFKKRLDLLNEIKEEEIEDLWMVD